MGLGKILAKNLLDQGIDSIYYNVNKKPFLQKIAVDILLKDLGIVEGAYYGFLADDECGIKILKGKGKEKSHFSLAKNGKDILYNFPKTPLFIIDMGFWDRHSEKEKKKLLLQLLLTISIIRKHLWDYNISVEHPPSNLQEKLGIQNKIRYNISPVGKTIVLNPYGDLVADESIIRNTDTFIIGGILDNTGWKNATTELSEKFHYNFPQVRIELRGSRVGVPDRINKIVNIILEVIEGKSLEDSIIENQSNADKYLRLLRDGENNLEEEAKWLKANEKVIKMARKVFSQTRPESSSYPQ